MATPEQIRYQQTEQYDCFRCIGAACEDTCCDGWIVSVDRQSYQKYQQCSHPVLGPKLQQFVQIQPAGASDQSFARIVSEGSTCPFLSEKLCSIQLELGEEYLGRTCASFPRLENRIGAVVERSLDLACPEAARLLLSQPEPAVFEEVFPQSAAAIMDPAGIEPSHPHFWEIRSSILSLLQDRRYTVAQRLLLVGHICESLQALPRGEGVMTLLEAFTMGLESGLYESHLQGRTADASAQLSIILELVVARIKLDFVPKSFSDFYSNIISTLHLTEQTTLTDAGARYARSYAAFHSSFGKEQQYVLEHYLVHYAYQTLFPFGKSAVSASPSSNSNHGTFATNYLLMASHFAIAQAMIVAVAAAQGSAFHPNHAIRCIQSCARTLEHCTSYPGQVLNILAAKGISSPAGISLLTQPPKAAHTPGFMGAAVGRSASLLSR